MCVCVRVCCSAGVSEVLIKYTGKYVNIYFNMKITYLYLFIIYVEKNLKSYQVIKENWLIGLVARQVCPVYHTQGIYFVANCLCKTHKEKKKN